MNFIKIWATSDEQNKEIIKFLDGLGIRYSSYHSYLDTQRILDCVCQISGVSAEEIKGNSRVRRISLARTAFGILAVKCRVDTHTVGMIINKDHSTVCHYTKYWNNVGRCDKDLSRLVEMAAKELGIEKYI